MWSWVDALNLALDYAKENPVENLDKLASEIWQEMQAENGALLEGRA